MRTATVLAIVSLVGLAAVVFGASPPQAPVPPQAPPVPAGWAAAEQTGWVDPTAATAVRPVQAVPQPVVYPTAVGPVVYPTAKPLPWGVDYDSARRESDRTGKPLLTWLTRPGCDPCVRLERTTFRDPTVTAELRGYVRVRVNGPDSPDLERAAGVDSYPTLVVSRPGTGVVTARVVGYVDPTELLARLRPAPSVQAAPGVAADPFRPDPFSTRPTGARPAGLPSTWWVGGTRTGPTPTSAPGAGWPGVTSLAPFGCPPRG